MGVGDDGIGLVDGEDAAGFVEAKGLAEGVEDAVDSFGSSFYSDVEEVSRPWQARMAIIRTDTTRTISPVLMPVPNLCRLSLSRLSNSRLSNSLSLSLSLSNSLKH